MFSLNEVQDVFTERQTEHDTFPLDVFPGSWDYFPLRELVHSVFRLIMAMERELGLLSSFTHSSPLMSDITGIGSFLNMQMFGSQSKGNSPALSTYNTHEAGGLDLSYQVLKWPVVFE